jgi:catecholate siderophore receptor
MTSSLIALLSVLSFATSSHPVSPADADSTAQSGKRDSRTTSPDSIQEKRKANRLKPVEVRDTADRKRGYRTRRVSSATKLSMNLRDVPQSVSIVSRDLIRDQSMQSMIDATRYIPGIGMGQGEGHRDAPTIRGNSSTADFFVDGVRDDVQYLRDLYNVERVEALKGPNAMIFGRGGGGGVINRVSKEAGWTSVRELSAEGGSYAHKRFMADLGQAFSTQLAGRLNGMFERSNLFRGPAEIERFGINPTLALSPGHNTDVRVGYELFDDSRTVDRGIPSYRGAPSDAAVSTFFGDPTLSQADARVNAATMSVRHGWGSGLSIRNHTRFADYDKFYQNVYPASLDETGTDVTISAYNNRTGRRNLFNQTDLGYGFATGPIAHATILGLEFGHQVTDNFRNTGYFNDVATSVTAPFANPRTSVPVTFRQSATDADNHVTTSVRSAYFQDYVTLSPAWQVIAGVRFETFDIEYNNNRNQDRLDRSDDMVSPRVGVVYKPIDLVSIYSSYSISFLPSSGDQFPSLNATSRTLEPERFQNREVGAKIDLLPGLGFTVAVYRLDRTNTNAPDPANPEHIVQTGSQRSKGVELGLSGEVTDSWQIAAGYASQSARITSRTNAAAEGATVPLVPHYTLSLWNRYQFGSNWGAGVGVIHQADMYAAIDNSVVLPAFTRLDAALYTPVLRGVRAQVNLENALNRKYFATSHGNNNILPGAPRSVRIGVLTGF